MFPSSTKREFRHFHVVVGQRRQRNVQKKRDARAKLLFCQSNLLLFCRSRCRPRRRCLRSLFKIQRHGRQRERQKNNRFYKQNNNFARAPRFFCTFLCPSLHDYDVNIPNFAFCGVRKQATTKIFFLFLHLDMVLENSTPGGFAYS